MSTPDNRTQGPTYSRSSGEYFLIADMIDNCTIELELELKEQLVFPIPRSTHHSELKPSDLSTDGRAILEKIELLNEISRDNRRKALQKLQEEMDEESRSDDFSDPPSTPSVGRRHRRVDSDSETEYYERALIPPIVTLQDDPDDTSSVTPNSSTPNDQHVPLQDGTTLENSNEPENEEVSVVEQTEIIYESDDDDQSVKEEETTGKCMIAKFESSSDSNTENEPLATGPNSPRDDTEIDDEVNDEQEVKSSVKRKNSTDGSRRGSPIKKRATDSK